MAGRSARWLDRRSLDRSTASTAFASITTPTFKSTASDSENNAQHTWDLDAGRDHRDQRFAWNGGDARRSAACRAADRGGFVARGGDSPADEELPDDGDGAARGRAPG